VGKVVKSFEIQGAMVRTCVRVWGRRWAEGRSTPGDPMWLGGGLCQCLSEGAQHGQASRGMHMWLWFMI
jgi:hypothetical protein